MTGSVRNRENLRYPVPSEKPDLIEALQHAAPYPHDTADIRLIETHISWVVLTGPFAYKIKKNLTLPFLDFSTLELRHRYCQAELALNRRLAPELYLDVVPIAGPAVNPQVGSEPALEYAVKMVQFPPEATADRCLESAPIPATAFATLADRLADFHRSLESEAAEPAGATVLRNLAELEADMAPGSADRLAPIAAQLRSMTDTLARPLAERVADGMVRECHGDLHLGNIAFIADRLVPFDCLEFDRKLRTIDVIDEIAFLYMDLKARDRQETAFGFLNCYLERSGDYAGVMLLRYYSAHRALVRAKVATLSGETQEDDAPGVAGLLALARAELEPAEPTPIFITCGLSASGKSTLARQIAQAFGAIHVRADIERKRLSGLGPLEDSGSGIGAGIYSRRQTEATYTRLAAHADACLRGRMPVIVDASFLDREQRGRFAELAARHGARFAIVWCTAPEYVLRKRLRERSRRDDEPSEADEAVLDHQLATQDPPDASECRHLIEIDTQRDFDIASVLSAVS